LIETHLRSFWQASASTPSHKSQAQTAGGSILKRRPLAGQEPTNHTAQALEAVQKGGALGNRSNAGAQRQPLRFYLLWSTRFLHWGRQSYCTWRSTVQRPLNLHQNFRTPHPAPADTNLLSRRGVINTLEGWSSDSILLNSVHQNDCIVILMAYCAICNQNLSAF
jgi:hypothetical protein